MFVDVQAPGQGAAPSDGTRPRHPESGPQSEPARFPEGGERRRQTLQPEVVGDEEKAKVSAGCCAPRLARPVGRDGPEESDPPPGG